MSRVCSFTGHREIPLNEYAEVFERCLREITWLFSNGFCYFCSGGARGFDMLAALAVIELKRTEPEAKLILVLPCRGHNKFWSNSDLEQYSYVLKHADEIFCLSESYTSDCMYKRNRYLVDTADTIISYQKRAHGGTAGTTAYAISTGRTVINIA